MQSNATTVEEHLGELPADRRAVLSEVRAVGSANLPEGYVEQMDRGVVAWDVPLELQPDTYNGKPLCHAALAWQKNLVSVSLMGLCFDGPELACFRQQYADRGLEPDMGKSCVRFKRLDDLPLDVLGTVIAMIPADGSIARHASSRGGRS